MERAFQQHHELLPLSNSTVLTTAGNSLDGGWVLIRAFCTYPVIPTNTLSLARLHITYFLWTHFILSLKYCRWPTQNRPQKSTDPTVKEVSWSHCISCAAFAILMLSITFATVKIHIYYLTAVRFTADITYKPCLLEINKLLGSEAGRKSHVNMNVVWGHFGMERWGKSLYIALKWGKEHKFWSYKMVSFTGLVKPFTTACPLSTLEQNTGWFFFPSGKLTDIFQYVLEYSLK